MPADRIKELEDEVEALKEANDGLYRQHANEKAQMQLAIEHEKVRVAELEEANNAYRDENDQWRLSYDALEVAKREGDEAWESQRRELEEKIVSLEDAIKSYTTELVNELQESEKEKNEVLVRDQTIDELQQQLNESSDRFSQLMVEYDNVTIAHEQLSNEKIAREAQFTTLESQLREYIGQLEAQVAEFQTHIQALSKDDQVKAVNQHALLKRAEQDVADKDTEIAQLTQKIAQLEDEVSLLTLTGGGGGDGKQGSNVMATLRDLQQQLFVKSEELVQQGEKHLQLATNYDKQKQQLQSTQQEVEVVRSMLLKGIVGDGVDESAYQHVKLSELVRLRLKSVEHELRLLNATSSSGALTKQDEMNDAATDVGAEADEEAGHDATDRPTTHLANVDSFSAVESFGMVGRLERELRLSRSRNKRLQTHIEQLQQEVEAAMNNLNEYQALKERAVELVSRERVEKELRIKSEANFKEATDKVVALSEHIEKLMVHLKHEAAAKTKAVDLHRRTDKELTECKDKLATLTKKNAIKDQQIQDLEQGAKILEDQLRLMDEKFIDVRNKLDWTRATTQKETKRLQNELSALRMKWQMASDMGALSALPDWVSTPKMKPKTKPLGSSSSDSRLVTGGGGSNNTATGSANGLSPLRNHSPDPYTMRFEIPKLPQPDSEAGTPWSDAKLSVLQRQLQDKRKV